MRIYIYILCLLLSTVSFASQREEHLSHSVINTLRTQINKPYSEIPLNRKMESVTWVTKALPYIKRFDIESRRPFLELVFYEASRAGLDPWLVLSVIQIESNFNRYATSRVGAQGFMQVMPFWVKSIGTPSQNLYDPGVNLRFGCTILRFYLLLEHGNLTRALARYNGSLGKLEYPNSIFNVWKKFNEPSLIAYN